MLIRAICVASTLHAATAVDRAQKAQGGQGAFPVFVTLVTDPALLVAAMGVRWTIGFGLARSQATIGEGVAAEAVPTVGGCHAGDAAVSLRITTQQVRLGTIAVRGARLAGVGDAVQVARARRQSAAARADSADSGDAARRAGTTGGRAGATRRGFVSPGPARQRGLVEREALVAGKHTGREPQSEAEQYAAEPGATDELQGPTVNRRASLAAKPLA